ncbi:MAG: class I SAM-dependent methyltransferase [Candidatus Shapirobacteria bacterium]|jgi:tRNA (mo5U34)-methyltransferase
MNKKSEDINKKKLADTQKIISDIAKVKSWYHQITLTPGVVTPGVNDSAQVLKLLNIPKNCRGLKVLDLGARDGFFSFELEKRGAQVLAVDYVPANSTGFDVAKKYLKSKTVQYRQDNIYNITPQKYGTFDIVLFLGLLYHLPDPIRALKIVRSVTKKSLYIETQGIENSFLLPDGSFAQLSAVAPVLSSTPIMQFYPKKTLNNDPSNYWAPNMACLVAMLEETNFKVVSQKVNGGRLIAECVVSSDHFTEAIMDIAVGNKMPNSW